MLDTFLVRAKSRPSAKALALAMEDGLRARLKPQQVGDVVLEFDNDSMPWYTVCIASGPDQPGALYAVSAAFTAADVVVHSARVSSSHDRISDRFMVSDRVGRKLDSKTMDRVRGALAGDRPRRRFGFRRD